METRKIDYRRAGTLDSAGIVLTVVGTEGTTTYGYRASFVTGVGEETHAGTQNSIKTGPATLSRTNYIKIQITGMHSGMDSIRIYRTINGSNPSDTGLIGTIPVYQNVVLKDTGQTAIAKYPSSQNSTGDIKVDGNVEADTLKGYVTKLALESAWQFDE